MSTAPAVNARLARITDLGTSVWLDQIRRNLVESGELARLVREDSLRGLTSNPAIFEKAILGSPDYDEQIEELTATGADAKALYLAIAVRDVQEAADVLRPVYDATEGYDGYVSFEVDPDLAHDTERTLAQAREYWALVDRPNLMIKIPGTDEGLPAITEALYGGINVNVTLLFSVTQYAKVCEAFITAMERRLADGLELDIHSVASFFVSRVDTEVDKRLAKLGRDDLAGKAGVANAQDAYVRYDDIFHGPRFAALQAAGCPVQRPLWASTGTKNPAYSEVLYVDGLAGPQTVNTMPMATLLAAAERSEATRATVADDPSAVLDGLKAAGIDMDDVTAVLLREGIAAFVTPMEKLLAGIESKREAIITHRPPTIDSSIPDHLKPGIAARVQRAAEQDVARRIWAKDDTLFGPAGQPEVANRLGWLTVTESMLEQVGELERFAQEVSAAGLTDCVLLGMGGSSLAPEVLWRAFQDREGYLALHVLDTTDPAGIAAAPVERSLFVVSSKSGGTIETLSAFEHFWELTGGDGSRFVAITDPGTPLEALARERGFRRVFNGDPDIGGRYSALSAFGLVPAALIGADVRGLLESAQVAEQACSAFDHSPANSGLWLGVTLGELALQGRDKLTFVVDPPLEAFGLWAEQLVAESTGKHGKGVVPVDGEGAGTPDMYGDDRVFVHVRNAEDPYDEYARHMAALAAAGQPVITVQAHGAADLGRVFFFAEFATAVAGWVLGINPFDQPDVQAAKDATTRVLTQGAPAIAEASDDDLRALLTPGPPAYVVIQAFVAPSDDVDELIDELRFHVGARTRMATTFGFGPRYLHSTGQLHKGGPSTGRFLQLVPEGGEDLAVPGKPFTFGELLRAQADGDLLTLREKGLPAERVLLRGDPIAALRELVTRVEALV